MSMTSNEIHEKKIQVNPGHLLPAHKWLHAEAETKAESKLRYP